MKSIIVLLLLCSIIRFIASLDVSFVSWNVNDNKRFESFSNELITTLLKLNVSTLKLPDIYAITLQENCLHCSKMNWHKIADAFIKVINEKKNVEYKLLSIEGTRKRSHCESVFCYGMHGTTLMFALSKVDGIEDVFTDRVEGCTKEWLGNAEKGIAVVGFKQNNSGICFGGLHFDLRSLSSRQKCITETLNKIKSNCQIIFFGGDFNSRPKPKTTIISKLFKSGQNKTFLNEMKETDDLSGTHPFSGSVNLLQYVKQEHNMKFIEPFGMPPKFVPTYSIDSAIKCSTSPVCYEPDRYPSWTDRIIYYPENKISCTEYSIIPSLSKLSDHIPIYANCEIKI